MSKSKKLFLILTVFFFVGALVFAGGPLRKKLIDPGQAPKPYADGEVLVKFKEGVDLAAITQFAAAQSLILKKQFGLLSKMKGQQIVHLKSTKKIDALVLADLLANDPSVEYAHPNYRRELAATPNDTYYSSLWGMHNTGQTGGTNDADIDAPEAWNISTGSSSVVVAVIDSGIDYHHPDLIANLWRNPGEVAGNGIDDDGNGYIDDIYGIDPAGADGSSTNPGDTDPMDGIGHGSHCAGTIGARGNNALGVVGVNWNVRIMALKFFGDYDGGGYDADAIESMQYVVYQKTHGQNVVAINASWGGVPGRTQDSGALRDAIEVVNNAGIVFCAAAGNGGSDGVSDNNDASGGSNHHYPSDFTLPGIISVAATDHNDALGTFSNYGAISVDLGAPGVSILSTVPGRYIPTAGDVFFDNFESGSGNWTSGGTNNTWGVTTNQEGWANANFPMPSPTHCLSDSPSGNYVNGTDSWMMNNANINLSGYVSQTLYLGFSAAWGINTGDHALVQISANGGSTWTTLYDQASDGYIYYWSRYAVVIPNALKTSQVRIRFRLTSNTDSANYWGFLIDNVGIGTTVTYPYESWDGTSMATPHVAGAVGYLASIFPNETVAQRKQRILYGGESKTSLSGKTVTGRRLNLFGAYSYTPSAQPSITVTAPNGGEVWMIGTARNITWTSTGTVGNVDIAYSLNSGVGWASVVTNTANDGLHSWTIPVVPPSTNCLIRIWERADHDPADTSDRVFAITANSAETVSTPTTPAGSITGMVGASLAYTTGGSTTSSGHAVQYLFDWGDSSNSGWLAVGTTSAAHSWSAAGTYNVRAMARCSTHWMQSAWSPTLPVTLDDTPTWVAISRFSACAAESQPTVEWHTASESGAVGFNLWRQDRASGQFELVTPSLLPALVNSPQGGIYRCADPTAFSGEPVTYRLEEVNAQGRTRSYGPFTVTFGAGPLQELADSGVRMGKEEPNDIYGFRRYGREQTPYEQERLASRRSELQKGTALAASPGSRRVRITVKGRGLIYVAAAQFAAKLGMSQNAAAALISGHNLKLTGLGREIFWLADANGGGLFFYNEGLQTTYADRNVYFLEQGRGLAMETLNGGNAGPADPGQSFQDTLHFEGNRYPLLLPAMNPAGDLWFWDYVIAGGAAKSFPIQVAAVAESGKAVLTVALHGATATAASDDHHAVISLNGRQIGDAAWDGATAHKFAIAFDASLLQEGGNAIAVSGALDTGAPYSTFYVDAFDLSYPRYYKAIDNSLVCRGNGNSVITVSGLSEPQAVVLDITSADKPKHLTGVAPDVSGRVTFVARAAGSLYLVSGLNASLRPLSVVGIQSAQLKAASHSAEHVVIAPEEFMATARTLANFRKNKGLKSVVVSLEDIYDTFNYGVPSPLAIRSFLAHAYAKWSGKKVRYAVLAGKGTYDYNDYRGYGDNMIPVIMARTPEGLCAADKSFGDVTGKDGLPEIAIGRLPAVSNAELQTMIDKIKVYENGQGAWTDRTFWISDNADDGGDFAQSSNGLASLATGYQTEKIYLNGSAIDTRARIIAAWNAGAALVNYCGHAGISQLAVENLFNVADAQALRNGGQLPLAVLLTCAAGRFELPGFTSLGEALALNPEGGVAGGLMPSGAALNADSVRLAEAFYKAVFSGKEASAGKALVAAMKSYLQGGGEASLLNVYNWLGDPALPCK